MPNKILHSSQRQISITPPPPNSERIYAIDVYFKEHRPTRFQERHIDLLRPPSSAFKRMTKDCVLKLCTALVQEQM